jgi:arginase
LGGRQYRHCTRGERSKLERIVTTGKSYGDTMQALADLDGLSPLVRDDDVALVGYRAVDDNDHFLGEHIRSTAILVVDAPQVRARGADHVLSKALATLTKPGLDGFWVHLDVDVLDSELFPATDYLQPDGLTFTELESLLSPLMGGGTVGFSLGCFNPDKDEDGQAGAQLVAMLKRLLGS